MTLESTIESLLFLKSEPVSVTWLASSLGKKEDEIQDALTRLGESLKERGIRLIAVNDTVSLGTAPEAGPLIEKITKAELEKDLGKAALETLTIVLYRGPITKPEIDYIRGVNSNFILRGLLIRGLIEREKNPKDERVFVYKPTVELMTYLGIGDISELPEYEEVRADILKFEKEFAEKENEMHHDGELTNDTREV